MPCMAALQLNLTPIFHLLTFVVVQSYIDKCIIVNPIISCFIIIAFVFEGQLSALPMNQEMTTAFSGKLNEVPHDFKLDKSNILMLGPTGCGKKRNLTVQSLRIKGLF